MRNAIAILLLIPCLAAADATTGTWKRYRKYQPATAPDGVGATRSTPQEWQEAALFGGDWPLLRTYRNLRPVIERDPDYARRFRAAVIEEDWFEGTHWNALWALEDGRTGEAIALAESLMDDERVPETYRERETLAAAVIAMRAAFRERSDAMAGQYARQVIGFGRTGYYNEAKGVLNMIARRKRHAE